MGSISDEFLPRKVHAYVHTFQLEARSGYWLSGQFPTSTSASCKLARLVKVVPHEELLERFPLMWEQGRGSQAPAGQLSGQG